MCRDSKPVTCCSSSVKQVSWVCALIGQCAWYTVQQRTVLIIFLLIVQTVMEAVMLGPAMLLLILIVWFPGPCGSPYIEGGRGLQHRKGFLALHCCWLCVKEVEVLPAAVHHDRHWSLTTPVVRELCPGLHLSTASTLRVWLGVLRAHYISGHQVLAIVHLDWPGPVAAHMDTSQLVGIIAPFFVDLFI